MEPEALVQEIATADPTRAKQLLKDNAGLPGVSRAYFGLLSSVAGNDAGDAKKLASYCDLIDRWGDEKSFAYRARAIKYRMSGDWIKCAESCIAAGRYATNDADRLAFQTGAVGFYARAGKVEEGVKLGKSLVRSLEKLGEKGLAARVKLNIAEALVWADDYDSARRFLYQAIPELRDNGYNLEAASAELSLSTAEMFGGHPAKSKEHAENARTLFTELGLPYYAALAAENMAHVAMLRGRADEALDLLLELQSQFEECSFDQARALEYLGDAYLRLNLLQEAEAAYQEALKSPGIKGTPVNIAGCHFGIAHAHLEMGQPEKALKAFRKALSNFIRGNNAVWVEAARVGEACALRTLRKTTHAQTASVSAATALRDLGSPYHLCLAHLESAESGVENLDLHLTQAMRIVRRYGFVGLAWRIHHLRAKSAVGQAKLQHYRRMFSSMMESRLLMNSTISRTGFMRDKSAALEAYLEALLERPTPKRVEEALDVIQRSRSAALLDELLAARSHELPSDARERLESLREELNTLVENEPSNGARRRFAGRSQDLANLQRRWVEATRPLQKSTAVRGAGGDIGNAIVFAEANGKYYSIQNGETKRLHLDRPSLTGVLRWLEFELMAPMAEADWDYAEAKDLVCSLVEKLGIPDEEMAPAISPDGLLWRVPWQVCMNLSEPFREPILLPTPAFGSSAGAATLKSEPNVALWYFDAPDLPHVKREAEMFLAAFPNATVCRSVGEVRASLSGGFDLLHVATHARINHDNPMFSYLEFDGGRLYATEIAQSDLRLSLVTLSACETGSMTLTLKQEPDGLARAFLARSAEAVVASAWPLDDEAALVTMKPLYDGLKQGKQLSVALGEARAACRSWKSHAYYWGPLVIFGGYSAGAFERNDRG